MIIGSGPAGLSAAIYSSRAGLKPVVVAPAMGGQLQGKGVGVENFPGVNESTGPNLVHLMQLQVPINVSINLLANADINLLAAAAA